MRSHIYYPIIDRMLSELERRFSNDACEVLVGASTLNPSHETFLKKEKRSDMATNYGVDQ